MPTCPLLCDIETSPQIPGTVHELKSCAAYQVSATGAWQHRNRPDKRGRRQLKPQGRGDCDACITHVRAHVCTLAYFVHMYTHTFTLGFTRDSRAPPSSLSPREGGNDVKAPSRALLHFICVQAIPVPNGWPRSHLWRLTVPLPRGRCDAQLPRVFPDRSGLSPCRRVDARGAGGSATRAPRRALTKLPATGSATVLERLSGSRERSHMERRALLWTRPGLKSWPDTRA